MVKSGFSLLEALVVMAVISIFFSVAAKVITTKPKPPTMNYSHSYFECYRSGGQLYQRSVTDGTEIYNKQVARCKFQPPTRAAVYNINSYSPNHTRFEPNINNELFITIDGSGNFVFSIEDGTSSYILESAEGISLKDSEQKLFFRMYPDSKIYNNGSMNKGVMISW